LVRTRLRHNIYCTGSVITVLGRYSTRLDFEFLQGVREWQRQRLITVRIVVDRAVQHKCQAVVRSAAHRNAVGRIVPRTAWQSATDGGAGKNNQFTDLAAI